MYLRLKHTFLSVIVLTWWIFMYSWTLDTSLQHLGFVQDPNAKDSDIGWGLKIFASLLWIAAFILRSHHHSRYLTRVSMAIPIVILQVMMVSKLNIPTYITLMITLVPIDTCSLFSWKLHSLSFIWNYIVLRNLPYVSKMVMSSTSCEIVRESEQFTYFQGFIVLLVELVIFATIEKLLKEFWVIRETDQKSFRTFMSIFNDSHYETLILSESLNVEFYNWAFENLMAEIFPKINYKNAQTFINPDYYESFKERIVNCIKTQKPSSFTVEISDKKNLDSKYILYNF